MRNVFILVFLFSFLTSTAFAKISLDTNLTFRSCLLDDEDFEVMITQNGDYFMPGQEFKMSIFSRCESSYQVTAIWIANEKQSWKKGNVLTYRFPVALAGFHEIPVIVAFQNKQGKSVRRNYKVTYTVGQPTFSISLDKMNVLYIGIDNPISVGTSWGGDEKIMISIQGAGGLITKVGQGKWIIRVRERSDDCIISLNVDGKLIGRSQFRVRNIPPPIGNVGSFLSGDSISMATFIKQAGVGTYNFNLGIDVHFSIKSYTLGVHTIGVQSKFIDVQGPAFTENVRRFLKENLKPGCTVTIGELVALGPDGKELKLLPIVYQIK